MIVLFYKPLNDNAHTIAVPQSYSINNLWKQKSNQLQIFTDPEGI